MDAATAVTDSPVLALLAFAGVLCLLLLLIAKWRWHVFLAMLIPIMLFGILPGVRRNNFIEAFQSGFGKTLGQIGVVIVLGSIIAEALKQTGAIQVITQSMVNLVGPRRMPLALTLTGFILGVAIFSDVAYVILNPLVHSSASTLGVGIASMSTGLAAALQLTHAVVPPTPGPLAAAALLEADLGITIFFGSVVCLIGSLAGWLWGVHFAGPRIKTLPSNAGTNERETSSPTALSSYAPIAVPLILIMAQSIAKSALPEGHVVRELLAYLGWPVVALSIGIWLAFRNINSSEERSQATGEWVEEGLRGSAMILVVTGLGGSLSGILRGTPAVTLVADFFQSSGLPAILLPFVLGIVGNMITGSSTVGVITAASLVAPMLPALPLSPEAAMLAGGCGSVIFKYVNSSYFWVCTSLSGLAVSDAIFCYGGATFVGGIASFATVCLLWYCGFL